MVIDAGFVDSDTAAVLEALANGAVDSVRRKQQDFLAFISYLSEHHWDRILDPSTSQGEKEDILFSLLRSLGLRLPTEPTLKLVSSFLMVVGESWEECSNRTVPYRKAHLSSIKAHWRPASRLCEPPAYWFKKLPPSPTEYSKTCPTMFKAIYGSAFPVAPKIDVVRLHMIDNSYKCRGFDSPCPVAPSSSPTVPNITNSLMPPQTMSMMEQFATCVMRGMQDMQSQQARMCEMLFNHGSGGGGSHRPRGLSSLLDSPMEHREPALRDSPRPTPQRRPGHVSFDVSPAPLSLEESRPFPSSGANPFGMQPLPGAEQEPSKPAGARASLEDAPSAGGALVVPQPPLMPPALKPSLMPPALKPPLMPPALNSIDDNDDDDAPLSLLRKTKTPAEEAMDRANAMLDRMAEKERQKKDSKKKAKQGELAVVAGALEAAPKGGSRGGGRRVGWGPACEAHAYQSEGTAS